MGVPQKASEFFQNFIQIPLQLDTNVGAHGLEDGPLVLLINRRASEEGSAFFLGCIWEVLAGFFDQPVDLGRDVGNHFFSRRHVTPPGFCRYRDDNYLLAS